MTSQPLTPEDEELRTKLEKLLHSQTEVVSCNKMADLVMPLIKQKELELLDFAVDVVEQFAYEPEDGKLTSGGLSTLERAFNILRRNGKLNKKGQYESPSNPQKGK